MPGLTQARPPGRQAESCRVLPAQVRPEGSFFARTALEWFLPLEGVRLSPELKGVLTLML